MAEQKAVGAQRGEVGSREGMRFHRVNSEPILKEEMLARGGEWVFPSVGNSAGRKTSYMGDNESLRAVGIWDSWRSMGSFKWAADSLVPFGSILMTSVRLD